MQNQVSVIGMYEVCFVVIVQCKYTRFFTFIGSGIFRRLNEISTEFDRFNLYVHIYIYMQNRIFAHSVDASI